MATDEKGKGDSKDEGTQKGKGKKFKAKKPHPFLWGLVIGLAVGVFGGWWFKPPAALSIDDLKLRTEEKFLDTKDQSREKLADFAEELAKKLRE